MADMKLLLEVFRNVRRQVSETIVLDVARDDEGNDFHVIRDGGAPKGQRLLYREPMDVQRASSKVAEARLEELRDRRIIDAILIAATGSSASAERADG